MDISIIEWAVYGFVAYSSLLMLIISTIKDVPTTKSLTIVRSIFMIPGIICAGILASSGVNITLDTTTTINIINATLFDNATNLVSMEITNSTSTGTNHITLLNPVWIIFHTFVFIILIVYVIQQMLILLTKHDEK